MADKRKIVILEDEQVLGEILLNKLISSGYDAAWETNGEDGLVRIKANMPDLVLLDIVMPKKDGYAVLEAMHADEALKNIPVVVISNSGQPVEISRILALGARDYIIKAQFRPEEVLEKVQKYLGSDATIATQAPTAAAKHEGKVWIVEDDTFLSSLSSGRLSKEGYTVRSLTDGAQALKTLEEEIPDLILLDIMMPGMNGFDVLKAIRADARTKETTVIMFSNLGQDHEIAEAKNLGANDFLVKARFTLKEVVDRINSFMEKKPKKS